MICRDTSPNYNINSSSIYFAGIPTFYASSSTIPARVVLHGHHPDDKQEEEENGGKLAHLPDSMEVLLTLAGEHHRNIVF